MKRRGRCIKRGKEWREREEKGRGEGCKPWSVALYITFEALDTRMVWFAVTATQVGDMMEHKVETSPALNIN